MKINVISAQNFKGLWIKKDSQNLGRDDVYGAQIVREDYTYHPFKNEDKDQIKASIEKFDGKTIHNYYNDGELPYQIIQVKVKKGESLPITSQEYAKVGSPLKSSAFEDKFIAKK